MTKKEEKFVETVWEYYKRHGRRSLPWRNTKNPYRILVSEVMLQQTQVERVIPKYREFLKQFPTVYALRDASLGDVLRVWQGLGYNRRAKMLHECAQDVVKKYRGLTPTTYEALVELSGVGPYTAGAVLAFAYNIPTPIIETNIRTVFIHHFFRGKNNIADTEIVQLIERTLDSENPREWYYALMDYGAHLKQTIGNQNTRSKHHVKQSAFKGSEREVRGAVMRLLTVQQYEEAILLKKLPFSEQSITLQLQKLCYEGLLVKRGVIYTLP